MTSDPNPEKEKLLICDLFKLEYEQAAQRYENIYKAIWQIFSYMAALAAAILAFSSNNLPFWLTLLIAFSPLLFWLVAIYIPMDSYGQQIRNRLAKIEDNINKEFLSRVNGDRHLKHYSEFNNLRTVNNQKPPWRVSKAVYVFAALAAFALIIAIAVKNSGLEPKSRSMAIKLEPPVQVQTQSPQLQELQSELTLLSKKLDSIESILRQKNIATPKKNETTPRK